ncbi:hypothetical protein GCM10007981_18770 [Thermocladium modestius]|uniref:Uncharacterized protein n=1 Tax=Thermocladium modestius TaxID=62609 RepID=A0A830GYS5_9CREN|nr:hypothetical protein GCM10007981_18770 [Thermocladium modestius]
MGDLLAGAIVLIVAILVIAIMFSVVQRQTTPASQPPPHQSSPVMVGGSPAAGSGYVVLEPAQSTAACSLTSGGDQYVINCRPRQSGGVLNVTKILLGRSGLLLIGTPVNQVPVAVEPPMVQLTVQPMVNYTKLGGKTTFLVAIYVTNNYSAYLPLNPNWVYLTASYNAGSGSATAIPLQLNSLMVPGSSVVITKEVQVTAQTAGLKAITFTVDEEVLGSTVASASVTAYLVVQG